MQYNSLREKIAAEKQARQDKYANFARVWQLACAKGMLAGEEHNPRPMRVTGDPNTYMDGVCGFAWLWMKGNTAFAKWAAKEGLVSSAYPTGVQHWISAFNQSYERKVACAQAMANVIEAELGIDVIARGRLD